jgi:hypothetical protein
MKSARKADGAQGRGQALPGWFFGFQFSVFSFRFGRLAPTGVKHIVGRVFRRHEVATDVSLYTMPWPTV